VLAAIVLAELSARLFASAAVTLGPSRGLWYSLWLACAGAVLVAMLERRAPLFGRVFWRGARDRPVAAITFDDGPSATDTTAILDILRERDVKATFFVLGLNADRHPDVVARAAREGHEIGNHGFDHAVLPLRGPRFTENQIAQTSATIERITGRRPVLFRASHGFRNPWVNRIARAHGCQTVGWTLGVWDTDRPGADVIVDRALSRMRNGCVLLLHDGRGIEPAPDASQVVEALPRILTELSARGMRLVTLSQLLSDAAQTQG